MNSLVDYVAFVPNVLSYEDCDTIIDWYNENIDKETQSGMNLGDVNNHRTSSSLSVPIETQIDIKLSSAIDNTLLIYIQTLNEKCKLKDSLQWINYLPQKLISENFSINRYAETQEYKWHIDEGDDYFREMGMFTRKFSIVLYLNDDFDGGETEFQFAKVKPQKGACLIFPSNFMYIHCARPVKNGVKYSVASWLAPLIEEDV